MNINLTIGGIIRDLETLQPNLHHATQTLIDQRHRIDTYTATTLDPIPNSDTTSTVERAVIARHAITLRLDGYRAELHALQLIIRNMRRSAELDMRRLGAPFTIDLPAPKRCDATSREGAIEWADPTCTRIPSRGPLCDTCAKREYRWRIRHGKPPRPDGVYAGDLTA